MIKLDGVTKKYKDFELKVSLELKEGTVYGLVGKNGAGKSTTIKLILGLIRATSGTVEVMGKNPFEFTPQDRTLIGTCMAESGFSRELNLKDIMDISVKFYKDFDKEYFLEVARRQELPLDKPLSSFSTGMKAKVRVLFAISHNARLLVLDEPTAGLDVMARNDILDMLRDYMAADEQRTMLISSHISSDLEGLCDEILIIDDGNIVLFEDTDSLLGKYAVIKVSESDYEQLDKSYITHVLKQPYGYECLTNEKQFYLENYPSLTIEKCSIDDTMTLMLGGQVTGSRKEAV
jgi:ABC-2 type transport system ATP-binding protein